MRDAGGAARDVVAPSTPMFHAPRPRSFEALVPIIDILLHHVLGMTVALLDLSFELLALAVYRGKVVVSELAPLFLDLADELLPVTFDTIPIHETLLSVGLPVVTGGTVPSERTDFRWDYPRYPRAGPHETKDVARYSVRAVNERRRELLV